MIFIAERERSYSYISHLPLDIHVQPIVYRGGEGGDIFCLHMLASDMFLLKTYSMLCITVTK